MKDVRHVLIADIRNVVWAKNKKEGLVNMKAGLIHIYTGNGKGKTTTAIGMAVRAAGQNLRVKIIQFLKGGHYTGEYIYSDNFPSIKVSQFGKPCLFEKKQLRLDSTSYSVRENFNCGDCRSCFIADEEEKMLAFDALKDTIDSVKSGNYDLVILDEINVALSRSLISLDAIVELIKSKPEHVELVLTGRNAPFELIEFADYVSEINEVKHPIHKDIYARRGIEY